MRAWILFGVLAFLVFGVPLIDELYRFRIRRLPKSADGCGSVTDVNAHLSNEGHGIENTQSARVLKKAA